MESYTHFVHLQTLYMIIHYLLFPLAAAPDVGISGWGTCGSGQLMRMLYKDSLNTQLEHSTGTGAKRGQGHCDSALGN